MVLVRVGPEAQSSEIRGYGGLPTSQGGHGLLGHFAVGRFSSLSMVSVPNPCVVCCGEARLTAHYSLIRNQLTAAASSTVMLKSPFSGITIAAIAATVIFVSSLNRGSILDS